MKINQIYKMVKKTEESLLDVMHFFKELSYGLFYERV